jgi:probable HAF family extracellular repeat protein
MAQVNRPRFSFLFKVSTFRRLPLRCWAAALVALELTVGIGNSATFTYKRVDYVNSDAGTALESTGRIVEKEIKLKSAGKKKNQSRPSVRDEGVETIFDLETRDFSDFVLKPANNNPDSSGRGQNINRDESCIVGYQDSGFSTPFHAFRWTQATNAVDLGTLDPPNNASRTSFATDTNQDCSVVVGFSDVTAGGATQHAFRWTSSGMVDLGTPANGGPNSRAFGVSGNGAVIVGDADFPAGAFTRKGAFRWAGGTYADLIPGLNPSLATAVSADGTAVVGQVGTTTASSAFRWTTQNPTMQPIGPLPGHVTAAATAVSDNGKIVVGVSNQSFLQYQGPVLGWNQGTAFRWTQATGIQDLRQILSDNGVDMTGIALVSVTGISPDGQWIQGAATTLQTGPGEPVAYIVQVCDDDIGAPCSQTGGTAPFTLGASPNQVTVSAGQSGTTTITVTPDAGFNQPVTFSCGGLPTGAACSFDPATVTPPGTVSTTLRITTSGGAVAMSSGASPTMFALLLTPLALGMTGMLWYRRSELQDTMKMSLLVFVVVAIASCSSSDSPPPADNSSGGAPTGTPAGTSTVTVTASSGGSSSGVPVTLTVTRP